MSRARTIALAFVVCATASPSQMIGINVLLNTPPTAAALEQLGACSQILDVIPEINAVFVKAQASDLQNIQSLPCVLAAQPDGPCTLKSVEAPMSNHFANGTSLWHLDAIDVTDFGTDRTVPYDGDGVYIAVIDSGLQHNWRDYFPEARIATEHARAFGGGMGEQGNVSSQPEKWEHDTNGHGTVVISAILGFAYYGVQEFNGVAPRATIIPIKAYGESNECSYSALTRAVIYVMNLKVTGVLGEAPVVINASYGGLLPDPVHRAALDAAIAQGIVVVAAAGNNAQSGMDFPGAYPEVISAGASGWVGEFPADDPSMIWWILRDVPEGSPSEHYIVPFSSHALPGQDLDVVAPGFAVPAAYTRAGQADYTFWGGTSASTPHVSGVAALMLQKNPSLTPAAIEAILESTAMPIPGGCRQVMFPFVGPGNEPMWSDFSNLTIAEITVCWDAAVSGHGLLRAGAALNATPLP